MSITRIGSTQGLEALPVISLVTVHNGVANLLGVTPEPVGDIAAQTRQVLDRIDGLLAQAGTDKSRLLTAQVWLSDMALFEQHNAAWNEWVDQENAPVRACVESRLWRPGLLVEIMVTAAVADR